jgi:Tol biopolymer transport system component
MHAILRETRPSLDRAPPELNDILDKALAKDPKERYHHASDFALDLRRFLAKPVSTASAPSGARQVRVLPWVVAAMLALAMPAVWWLGHRQASAAIENPIANARFTRLTDFAGDKLDAAISPDGRFVAFLADRDGPFDVFLTQVGSGRFINLTQGKEPSLRSALRGVGFSGDGSELWLHADDGLSPVRTIPLMGGQPRVFLGKLSQNVAWSPDTLRIAYHTADPGDPIFVADRTGANARQILVARPGVHNHYPVWSTDGKWIYFVRGIPAARQMDVWRVASDGAEPERLTRHNSAVAYPTPLDRRTLLYISRDVDGSGPWLWALDVDRKLTRRVSVGFEKFTSVAASGDGRRLVATVANPVANLWSVPILDHPAGVSAVKPLPLPSGRALMPRFGGATLFYLSSQGAGDGLWRYHDGQALEIWKGTDGALLEPPAVSQDGKWVAFVLRRDGRLRLWIETADGTDPRLAAEKLDVQGAACWSPDSRWIATGGADAQGSGLFKIPADGGEPVRLTQEPALNPVWSSDGALIAYAAANVGPFAPLHAVRPDGAPVNLPEIKLQRDGERIRFLRNSASLIYTKGLAASLDLWLLDLVTKNTRPLTRLADLATMRSFDIALDGKHIVFDRLRDNSDVVLIDLPK